MPFLSEQFANLVKMHSGKMDQSYGHTRYAILKEYDPENNAVKVAWYDPDTDDHDLISGWLPIIVPFIGKGDDTGAGGGTPSGGNPWGVVHPANIGQPVVVISQHGDFNNGLVIGGTYSSISPPPQVDGEFTQDGEFLIMHKSGSYLKFFNDGHVTLHTDKDFDVKVGQDWNVTVERNTTFVLKGNFDRTVTGDESATIKGNQNLNLSGNLNENINGSVNQSIGGTLNVDAGGTITFVAPQINLD